MRWRTVGAFIAAVVASATALSAQGTPCDPAEGRTCETEPSPLPALGIEVDGSARQIAGIEIVGLTHLTESRLWEALPRPTTPCTFAEAAAVVRALAGTEAFSSVATRLRVVRSGDVTLEIRLAEYPWVRDVVVHGASEVPDSQIVADLLGQPRTTLASEAPAAAPTWFAWNEDGTFRPGLLSGGVEHAVQRVMSGLFDAGYRMSGASGTLSTDGLLTIDVDEGRIGTLEIVSPARHLTRAIEQTLALPIGRTFLEADVSEAVKRVEREMPFLQAERAVRPTRALPAVAVSEDASGGQRFALRASPPAESNSVFAVEGHTLTLYFNAGTRVRFVASSADLLRHTPVGGIGVALGLGLTLWDPKDRVHVRIDSFSGTLDERTRDAVGTDLGEYGSSLRFQVPALRISDFYLEAHGHLATSDAWRNGRSSSYLNSLLFERPDREYYWRNGSSTGITFQPRRRMLLAAEYNDDDDRSVAALPESSSVFTPEHRFVNPPVDEGHVSALVLRSELSSEPIRADDIVSLFRSPDTSIVARPLSWGTRSAYHLLATLEIASRDMQTDSRFDYTRFVADGVLFLATGAQSGLRVRGRVAGGSHLPLQKQEALGGWSALRGFEFKEFRGGDWSLLGMIEYRHVWVSGFLDLGALHRPQQGWSGPHAGVGAKLHFDGLPIIGRWMRGRRLLLPLQLACAWRLDQRTAAKPELRLLIGQAF
jgi:hypothetical protein